MVSDGAAGDGGGGGGRRLFEGEVQQGTGNAKANGYGFGERDGGNHLPVEIHAVAAVQIANPPLAVFGSGNLDVAAADVFVLDADLRIVGAADLERRFERKLGGRMIADFYFDCYAGRGHSG